MRASTGGLAFARETFGGAELGDLRRTRALVAFVAALIRKPAGKVTEVFTSTAKRERAYKFLENRAVKVTAVISAMARSVAARIVEAEMAYVVVDGSSLTLADPRGRKDFGQVGNHHKGARGLKVITAYVVEPSGVPMGILGQKFWARLKRMRRGSKGTDNRRRAVQEKETQHWLDVIRGAAKHADPSKLWFLVDREGDSREMLLALEMLEVRFTIRSSWNRLLVAGSNGKRRYLRGVMAKAAVVADYAVDVPAAHNRRARTAKMRARSATVRLLLKDRWRSTSSVLEVNVVWAVEVGTTPACEKPLDWMLLSNAPAGTAEEALAIIRSYQVRWRIEEFHKAWKSGHCKVENTQLHSMRAASIFATMHAAVAARAERLKYLSREAPEQAASTEFTYAERLAIAALAYEELSEPPAPGGRRQTKLTVPDPNTMTMEVAAFWLARFGGYTGKSSGGPPGGITIGRGLADVLVAARAIIAAGLLKQG